MATIVVTLDAAGPEASGQRARVTGTLVFSGTYSTGGDSVATNLFALATVEDLYLFTPRTTTGAAITSIIWPVVRTVLPVRNSTMIIQAFLDTSTEASGDISTYVFPFLALGVGI